MSKFSNPARLMALIVALAMSPFRSSADINAVTVTNGYPSAGAFVGAVGFTFMPTTNITVTSVKLLDAAFHDAIVSFWSSTNFVFATFDLGPTSNTYGTFSSNINITLVAGESYSITIQDGPLSSGYGVSVDGYLPETSAQILVAPQLTGYYADLVSPAGAFVSTATNAFLFGVNFSFVTTNSTVPQLGIQLASSNSAVVSWPSPSTGFFLEKTTNLIPAIWLDFTGPTNDNGTTKSVTISPAAGNQFFRLRPN